MTTGAPATGGAGTGRDGGPFARGRGDHRVLSGGNRSAAAGAAPAGTRERILDVALELFVDQGFDKTSLREIAERLDVTKAALYYHFQSKDDILMALHMRMHDLMRSGLVELAARPPSRASWVAFLDGIVDQIAAGSRLFLMYQRNPGVFGDLHHRDHGGAEVEPDQLFHTMLDDPGLSLDDRVRISGSLGVVLAGASMLMEPSARNVDPAALARTLRAAVRDLLRTGERAAAP